MAHIFNLKHPTEKLRVEVHALNVGDHFPDFGGSRRGLTARKTASIVTRTVDGWGLKDTEWDIYSPDLWAWIAKITTKHGFVMESVQPVKEEDDT